jgi:hypothetical protein
MKKFAAILVTILLTYTTAQAQETIVVPDTLAGWDYGWVAGLNGAQASYSNWSQGGVNNIAVSGNSTFRTYYRDGKFSYGFLINTRYGKTRIDGEGTRKTDDRFSIRNRFLYDLGGDESQFSVYGNLNFRTQFDRGFEYGDGDGDPDILISNFLSPGYITESVGLLYRPSEQLSFEAGLGLQQTIVQDESVLANRQYGVPDGENFRNEAGANLGVSYQRNISSNIVLSSTAETFTNLNKSLSSTDLYFSNEFIGNLNDFINTSLRFDIAYDDDFSNELQVRQSITVGISFILI